MASRPRRRVNHRAILESAGAMIYASRLMRRFGANRRAELSAQALRAGIA
jgi:hypothetical protein